jgi:hypothetical protein
MIWVPFTQARSRSDVQFDGLAGPVRSISSTVTPARDVKWQQPSGPTLVEPIWCRDCEYDSDGSKTTSGQVMDGKFYGEVIRLVRDGNGNVTDRYAYSSSTGELERHDVMGPYGKTEQRAYVAGKLRFRSTFAYDAYGNITEWRSFNAAGASDGYTLTSSTKDGTLLNRSTYAKDGTLSSEQTYDPETGTDHFTTYDEFGKLKLTWTVVQGKVTSFWEPSDSPTQFGDGFIEPKGEGNVDNFDCHNDLRCDISRVHYEYLDGDKHTPLSAEWRDAEGTLQLAAYFEYEVDSYHNWTTRRVWAWNPAIAKRTLFETDSRVITYWK